MIHDSKKPLISIITTCLNAQKTIEKAMLSVFDQTYKNIEYIIIDGGSSDESKNIIKKYEDKIAYWVSEKDSGISDGWNKGIQKATGEIIGILNADDWYEKDTIATIVELHTTYCKDFYVGSLRYWAENQYSFVVDTDPDFDKKLSYKMPRVNHPSSFFKKSVYDDIGLFNKERKYAMDYDFFIRAIKNKKTFYISHKVFTNMALGGKSHANAFNSYKEVLGIAQNKILGCLWFIYSIIKLYLRKIISFIRLEKMLITIKYRTNGTKYL